mmetsp:Transcript_74525/g.216142  ORF Transcript_74525/g.216142 Transcript_74525/m.216142 type:complete len:285 (-) Transcript_74525:2273-3127(-)
MAVNMLCRLLVVAPKLGSRSIAGARAFAGRRCDRGRLRGVGSGRASALTGAASTGNICRLCAVLGSNILRLWLRGRLAIAAAARGGDLALPRQRRAVVPAFVVGAVADGVGHDVPRATRVGDGVSFVTPFHTAGSAAAGALSTAGIPRDLGIVSSVVDVEVVEADDAAAQTAPEEGPADWGPGRGAHLQDHGFQVVRNKRQVDGHPQRGSEPPWRRVVRGAAGLMGRAAAATGNAVRRRVQSRRPISIGNATRRRRPVRRRHLLRLAGLIAYGVTGLRHFLGLR